MKSASEFNSEIKADHHIPVGCQGNEKILNNIFFKFKCGKFWINSYDLIFTDIISRREKDLPSFLGGSERKPSTESGRSKIN